MGAAEYDTMKYCQKKGKGHFIINSSSTARSQKRIENEVEA